jgi:hypothetical protein
VGSNLNGCMDVCLLCVLSGRGLCDELITSPEESYRLWRVVVCDHENLVDEGAIARAGLQSQKKKPFEVYIPHALNWKKFDYYSISVSSVCVQMLSASKCPKQHLLVGYCNV